MAATSTARLSAALGACSVLVGVADPPPRLTAVKETLSSILARRLSAFSAQIALEGLPALGESPTERSLKLATSHAASLALQLIASSVSAPSPPTASTSTAPNAAPPPTFGAKDIKVLGMLAGIVARWGVGLKVAEGVLPSALVDKPAGQKGKIAEITEEDEEMGQQSLEEVVKGLLAITRLGKEASEGSKQLAQIVVPQVLLPLLGGLLQLGYGAHAGSAGDWARTALQRLCTSTSPTIIISNFLALLSSPSSIPSTAAWLRPAVSSLLSSQLLRNGGVRSLLLVVVGPGAVAGGEDEVGVKKLDMVNRLLGAKAPGVTEQAYFTNITTQLLAILQAASAASLAPKPSPGSQATALPSPPVPILRAAAFVLAHVLISSNTSPIISSILLPSLHGPFLPALYPPSAPKTEDDHDDGSLAPPLVTSSHLLHILTTLSALLLYSPPLPTLQSTLLIPILPSLLSLSSFTAPEDDADAEGLSKQKQKSRVRIFEPDQRFGDEVRAVLEVWGRSVEVREGVREVGKAVERWEAGAEFGAVASGEDGESEKEGELEWARDDEGGVCVRRSEVEGVEGGAGGQLKIKVDPEGVVKWLKDVGRKELSGALFLRWLDEVQALRGQQGFGAAKRSVVRLQLVLKMVDELGSEILNEPPQVIAFVAHALDADEPSVVDEEHASAPKPSKPVNASSGRFGLADLKIVDDEELDDGAPAEVQEEEENEETLVPGLGKDEMVMTALTLLLAVLESNDDLDMSNTPLLALIFSKLDSFASSSSTVVPPLAKEAKMVLYLRRASSFASVSHPTDSKDSAAADTLAASRSTYQEALKLLQDPLLPVRAQGLALLRSLISTRSAFLSTDPALLPAVLDIMVQALEDEDSFLYLNAIQGLSSMADVYGRQIVARLVEVYIGGQGDKSRREVGLGEKGRRELDKRLRMGEALVQVVQRAGEALAVFVDELVPSLLFVLRTPTLPTPLRSSALTILATTIETSPLALMPQSDLLTEACLTLLTVESRPLQSRRREEPAPVPKARRESSTSDDETDSEEEEEPPVQLGRDGKPRRPEETPDPISRIDSKHPSLRRAAILFLGMLFRTAAHLSAEAVEEAAGYDELNPLGTLRMPGSGSVSVKSGVGRTGGAVLVSREAKEQAKVVLRYVGETDEDSLVRHQAGEVSEEL